MNPLLSKVLVGMAAAALVDINAFLASRAKDPSAKFDGTLCAFRLAQGALVGFVGAQIPTTPAQ